MDKFKLETEDTGNVVELTRSPQLNEMIKIAEKIKQGTGDIQELQQRFMDLEQVTIQMIQLFNHELKFQEKTPENIEEFDIIDANFKELKEGIYILRKYFKSSDLNHLEEGLDICSNAFAELFASFDRLKEMEAQREKFSESPLMNELLRVADCVRRKTLPVEALKERLEALLAIEKNFLANLDNIRPTADERMIFDESKEKIRKEVKNIINGLTEAQNYFKDFKEEHIDKGLTSANESAEKLVAIEAKLKEAREKPKVKLCFRCGTENIRSARYCKKCNFNFPPLQMEEESTVDLRLEEEGIKQTGHIMTENLQKIYNAVENIRMKKISTEKYMETVQWFAGVLKKVKEDQKKIPTPQHPEDPQVKEAFDKFVETFETGVREVEEGLDMIRLYPETKDTNQLQNGMEKIFSGGDRLYQVKAASDAMQYAMEMARQRGE